MTGWGSIDTAVEAMRRGARTFVHKPWNNATMAAAIVREVRDGIALRQAQALAERQQRDARASQRALLPSSWPRIAGCEMAARWIPASDLGGDCYDVIPIAPQMLGISIADVCGKGVAAALVMSHLQASVRAFAAAQPAPPCLAASVNQVLCRNAGLAHFVTFFYATYDAAARRLTYTNAGHNPPLVVRADGSVHRLTAGGMVLGVFDPMTFDQGDLTLSAGDRLVLYTDGIVEATDEDEEEFGSRRLVEAVRRTRAAAPAAIVDAIFEAVSGFTGGRLQDDATVMVVAVE
jgi:sigma-B regulation protein RsbU (phosphoserine phosphatase)